MNCQDVNEILDTQRFDQIGSHQRHQVETHLATCADCARTWDALASLAALPDMAMPAAFQAQCRAAVAARCTPGTAAGRPRPRRVLLWGSLTALAAAAAMLLLLFMPALRSTPVQTDQLAQREAATSSVDAAPTAQPGGVGPAAANTTPAAAITTLAAPQMSIQVVMREPPSVGPDQMSAVAADPLAQEVLQSLHAELVAQLRRVPGLAVVDKDPEQITAPARHYRLRIGPLVVMGLDGRPMRQEHRGHDIGFTVEEVKSGGAIIRTQLPVGGFSVDPRATCTSLDAAERMPCNAPTAAAYLVDQLRQKVFPPDASMTRPLQAKVRDFSVAPEERFAAFVELFRQQARTGGKNLFSDDDMVRAAIELSGLTDAEHRRQLWRAMRGVGDVSLVEPLLASLQQDPEAVRLAAVETLGADFSGHPLARSALETAASSDPEPLVRALAQRGLSGEAAWQDYLASSLKDATLPASQRVEALLHELYPPDPVDGIPAASPANYWEVLQGLDDAEVRALADAFPKAEQLRKWPGNNLLGNFAAVQRKNPAVTDMLLTVLEEDTRASNRSVAGQALAQMHAREPRVRDALIKAASSDPDASVRDYIGQTLQADHVKKSMEEAAAR